MPRIKRGLEPTPRAARYPQLVAQLADELRNESESGQPVIEETHFRETGKFRTSVLWDAWDKVPFEDRGDIILKAYELAEGREVRERIALAVGQTFPEAHEDGLLRFWVRPMLRKSDATTREECDEALKAEGASLLFPGGRPQLRFATKAEAEAAIRRLTARLPGSADIWSTIDYDPTATNDDL